MAGRLEELGSVTIEALANDDGHLFGSVTAHHIADTLENEGLPVGVKAVRLEEPIKELGVFKVPIKLKTEQEVSLKIWVIQSKEADEGEGDDE